MIELTVGRIVPINPMFTKRLRSKLNIADDQVFLAPAWTDINACVIFGYIIVSKLLILKLSSAEVEAVIAHEIGHIHMGHSPLALSGPDEEKREFEADNFAVMHTSLPAVLSGLLFWQRQLQPHCHHQILRRIVNLVS